MSANETDVNAPIYLVTPEGQYVLDDAGNPVVFAGGATQNHESGYLVDEYGNFLLRNNEYIPAVIKQEEEKKKRKILPIILGVLLIIALGVGAGVLTYHFTSQGSDSDKESTASPSQSATEGDNAPTSASTKSSDDASPQEIEETSTSRIPPEAHPSAGSADIPPNAVYVKTSYGSDRLEVQSPTKNIHCESNDEPRYIYCTVMSWSTDRLFPNDSASGMESFYSLIRMTSEGEVDFSSPSQGWDWDETYTLQYGSIAYNGNWVCASEENGMTCWSRASGHGFFVNRDGYKTF